MGEAWAGRSVVDPSSRARQQGKVRTGAALMRQGRIRKTSGSRWQRPRKMEKEKQTKGWQKLREAMGAKTEGVSVSGGRDHAGHGARSTKEERAIRKGMAGKNAKTGCHRSGLSGIWQSTLIPDQDEDSMKFRRKLQIIAISIKSGKPHQSLPEVPDSFCKEDWAWAWPLPRPTQAEPEPGSG